MKEFNRKSIWFVVAVLPLLLLGCVPAAVEPTELPPTGTPTTTLTPTATIDWFPATETPTLLPTQPRTPTPELKPGLGDVLLDDDFSDEEAWTLREIENGRAALSNNHITLSLNQPDGLVYGFRPTPEADDFYAEVTASPNFCQPEDEYGLMVRISGPRLNHYRLAVSCNGQAGALRVVNNRGNIIQEWVARPFIPVSFPSESKLAVWMQGPNLRFFVNDRLVYELTDAVIQQGAFGLYVFGSGGSPISVNFSDLVIYELESEG